MPAKGRMRREKTQETTKAEIFPEEGKAHLSEEATEKQGIL